jgi:hypothetical protein
MTFLKDHDLIQIVTMIISNIALEIHGNYENEIVTLNITKLSNSSN